MGQADIRPRVDSTTNMAALKRKEDEGYRKGRGIDKTVVLTVSTRAQRRVQVHSDVILSSSFVLCSFVGLRFLRELAAEGDFRKYQTDYGVHFDPFVIDFFNSLVILPLP